MSDDDVLDDLEQLGFVRVEHAKENYITKCTAVDAADIPTPLWDNFLLRVVPNTEVRAFLYRWFGYALTGDTNEQCFLFLYGYGQNGKGVFIDTLRAVFGSYAAQASITLLIRQRYQQHPEELAALRAVRLVVADETDKGTAWDEAKLKHMVSGERVRARFMRGNSFEFTPTWHIVVIGNNKPALGDVGKAMRRRIILVPFNVEIPDTEKNLKLKEDLIPEWPGILFKLMRGLQEYKRIGLMVPKMISDATDEYIDEEDSVGQWIEEAGLISRNPNDWCSCDALFGNWGVWAGNAGEPRGSKKQLTRALKSKGFKYGRDNAGRRGFFGLRIPQVGPQPGEDDYVNFRR